MFLLLVFAVLRHVSKLRSMAIRTLYIGLER